METRSCESRAASQNTQSEMLLLTKLDTPCSILELFSFLPTATSRPQASALRDSQPAWVASRPDTPASFSLIFQNKGVLKLLIIIPGRCVALRRLGGDGGCHDGGELRQSRRGPRCHGGGKTATWKRDGKRNQGKKEEGEVSWEPDEGVGEMTWKWKRIEACGRTFGNF